MKRFIVAAKIEFSIDGVITTLGVASGPYFASAAGLLRSTWFPILDERVAVEIDVALPWESGGAVDSFGAIELINGADGLDDHLLDQLIGAQVSGMNVEVRRGYDDEEFSALRLWTKSHSDRLEFKGERLTITQRSALDAVDQPLTNKVFDESTPNPRLVNQTPPLLLGPAFQIEALIFDAPNQAYYIAENVSKIRAAHEGGAETDNFVPIEFGAQMTAGTSLQITFDAIGPPPPAASETLLVEWNFDAWTGDDPDGIDVFETAGEATISESSPGSGTAEIVILGTASGNTGLVSFTDPFLFAPFGTATAGDWTASSGTVPDAIVIDDGSFATVSTWRSAPLSIQGIDPNIPAGSVVTGISIEVIEEGTNVEWDQFTVVDRNGYTIAALAGVSGGLDRNFAAGKNTETGGGPNFKTSSRTFDADLINQGIGVYMSVRQQAPGSVGTAKIYQVRVNVHYATEVKTVRLYTPTGVLTAGRRCRLEIVTTAANCVAKFGTPAASGDPINAFSDPFSQSQMTLSGEGVRTAQFSAEAEFFGLEFERSITAGTATIERVRLYEVQDGINSYPQLVDYMAGLVGLDAETDVDSSFIDAHDAACGSPELGWYITDNTAMSEIMDLFARSLSGVWWRDRDAKIRSTLWHLDETADAAVTIENVIVDGQARAVQIVGEATMTTIDEPGATERAVGARNWRPLSVSEMAGITEEFTEQDRANLSEQWRIIRRANFAALNPWTPPAPFVLSLDSISPTSGSEAGGDEITATGNFDTGQSIAFTVGGVAATGAVVDNATTARFTTPAGTVGTVDVIATQGAQNDTLAGAFQYTAASAWTPADISTALWLKYNDSGTLTLDGSGNIEQANDKSGNARHSTQTNSALRPAVTTLNGKNAANFADKVMNIPQLPAGDYSHFVISSGTDPGGSDTVSLLGASNNSYIPIAQNGTNTGYLRINSIDNPAGHLILINGATSQTIATRGDAKSALVDAGTVLSVWQGIPAISAVWEVGRGGGSTAWYWNGPIAEIVSVPEPITLADRQKVEGYLAHEWGIASKLPASHPYKSSPP